MRQHLRIRGQETIEYASGQVKTRELSRGMTYRELVLRLQGAPTLTAGNNTEAKLERGDEWSIITDLAVRINSDTVIRRFTGDELFWLNRYYYGRTPRLTAALGDGATANPAFDSCLVLPFWTPRTAKPWDTVLESGKLSGLHLDVTWGSHTALNADATAWTTTPTLELTSVESFGGPDNPDPGAGMAHDLTRIHRIVAEPTAANEQYQIKLPVGNRVYERFIINARNSSGVDSAAIISNVKLRSAGVEFVNIKATTLRQWANTRLAIDEGWDHSSETYPANGVRRSADNAPGGWYYLDLLTDGYGTEGIDARALAELTLELDVDAAGTIVVLPMERIPLT